VSTGEKPRLRPLDGDAPGPTPRDRPPLDPTVVMAMGIAKTAKAKRAMMDAVGSLPDRKQRCAAETDVVNWTRNTMTMLMTAIREREGI
jgi:hypothetical protein